ncbi:MAG TPA: hypothetical protein VMD91_16060 [Candidatus Sulfotelmatobacter sp.]|nr:hypothetical protein [Candidatus Sulfotelmatobacter sp.]
MSIKGIAVLGALGVLISLPLPAKADNLFTCVQNLDTRHNYCSEKKKNGHVAQADWVAKAVEHFSIPARRSVNTYGVSQCDKKNVTCWEPPRS